MNHLSTSFTLPDHQVSDFAAHQRTLRQWWHRLPGGLQSPVWLVIIGSLMILGMLLAFHQVVHDAVQQGELRQKTNALQAEAVGRCHILRGRDARDICLLQLSALGQGMGQSTAQSMQLASQ
ncbi:hypothetical protein [Rhodoferax sp.]|uniref:hypothetical protein n=1 Tax=Rhodoferax sp. TaxID=50421 RepID=UPI00374CE963